MAIGQVGFKSEVTWGTAVTPDKFMPILVARSGSGVPEQVQRQAITGSRRIRRPGKSGRVMVKPHLELEVSNKNGIGTLLKHIHGGVVTTGSSPYTHTYNFATPLTDSLTVQVGIPDAADTVEPFTVAGFKPDTAVFSCAVGEPLKLVIDGSAKTAVTATALASASYSDDEAFIFTEGTVSVGGSAVASARSFTLTIAKNLRTERFVLGSPYTREQLEEGFYDVTLSIEADFDALTLYALAVARTQVAISIPFTSTGSGGETLTWTMSGQVVGDPPELSTPGLASQTLNLEVSHGTSDASAYTLVLANSTESSAA